MDSEIGRCRRTDGKRWRCHQSVVPNEKYCVKHINRGRKRSRKLVEESLGNSTGSIPGSEVPAINNRGSHPRNEMSRIAIKAPNTEKVETSNEEKHEIVVKERIAAINLALGLDVSPSENASRDGRRCAEAEHSVRPPRDILPRCKRTDGRRWHCHNIALPGIKYCAKHRNRAKVFSPSAQEPTNPVQQKRGLGMGMGLGMDLNMMLPAKLASPSLNIRDHTSSSTSSDPSTETTISDESAYMSNVVAVVSPSFQ